MMRTSGATGSTRPRRDYSGEASADVFEYAAGAKNPRMYVSATIAQHMSDEIVQLGRTVGLIDLAFLPLYISCLFYINKKGMIGIKFKSQFQKCLEIPRNRSDFGKEFFIEPFAANSASAIAAQKAAERDRLLCA